ncbi:MAG: hypothetical protein HC842_02915 [Cytophagales bacterium]|nr:hypothetical protein [Cytophagales bacterium]
MPYDNVWLGVQSNDWFYPQNWRNQVVPTSLQTVWIPNTGLSQPLISAGIGEARTVVVDVPGGALLSIDVNASGRLQLSPP